MSVSSLVARRASAPRPCRARGPDESTASPKSGAAGGLKRGPSPRFNSGSPHDFELHSELVFDLDGSACHLDWLDAEVALLDGNFAAVCGIYTCDRERNSSGLPVDGCRALRIYRSVLARYVGD